MRTVRLADQVIDFIRHLPPEPKRRIRAALKDLKHFKGDLKELEHPLEGYCRVRVFQFRIIVKIHPHRVDCIFIERRSIVYEVFATDVIR